MSMIKTKIVSLNIGAPRPMLWGEKQVLSSMLKESVPGPLKVSPTAIDGDAFAYSSHGSADSVVYIYGVSSALNFVNRLGLSAYTPGSLGENITVPEFDETKISVGDIFQIGAVKVQATGPRIPCSKVNIRMQNSEGQKQMILAGRSGVYFRILEAGEVHLHDEVVQIEACPDPLLISDVY